MEKIKTTKEDLIIKSLEIFGLQGYHNTSFKDLAAACNIPSSLFYYYFKDGKEELMTEVLKYVVHSSVKKLKELAQNPEILVKDKLAKISRFMERLYLENPAGCIMGNTTLETALLEPRFLPTLKEFFKDWIEAYTIIYQTQYQPDKALELAEATVQDIEGGIMLMKLFQDKKYLRNALRRSEKWLD
ncbi:MAG: TetR/AcrR family transcriptional regulator [Microscillaceae bacterium]|jgi:TetR/AcrR family transcriptional repressor of nem operon|nr:TetR/AcrR family transcriptional regulator [Microscillaceae bacterium]